MKNMIVRTLFGVFTASVLLTGQVRAQPMPPPLPHLAQARLDVPVESPGIPAYVRLENIGVGWVAPRDADWTALIFYRDPACIPTSFDLTGFFDFPGPQGIGAFACPLTVEGFDLRFQHMNPALPPDYTYLRNRSPEMPIWFVSSTELDALLDRGFLYVDEIEALPSLVVARAWKFEEQLSPGGVNDRPGLTMSASGRLETGGRFSFLWHNHPANGENVFELQADLPRNTRPPRRPDYTCLIYPQLPRCKN